MLIKIRALTTTTTIPIFLTLWLALLMGDSEDFCSNSNCMCLNDVIDCRSDAEISQMPANLDKKHTKLFIYDAKFYTTSLTKDSFVGLRNVVSLKIVQSSIETIQSFAFSQLPNLRDLDLSFNNITRIHANAFNGLTLESLQLSNQNGNLRLDPDSFQGLKVKSLFLRDNQMSEINANVYRQISGLSQLFLSRNNIKTVPVEYIREYFDRDDRLLDLTDNPLRCDCSLDWLSNRVNSWSRNMRDLNLTCRYEEKNHFETLSGRYVTLEMANLNSKKLCPKTDIQTIEVDFAEDAELVTLKCIVKSLPNIDPNELVKRFNEIYQKGRLNVNNIFNLAPPNLSWSYYNSHGDEIVTRKNSIQQDLNDMSVSILDLNVTLEDAIDSRNFTCKAWDDSNETSLLVNLRGLSKLKKKKVTPPDSSSRGLPKVLGAFQSAHMDHEYYLLKKQFTLIEMFGAITGTFLVTLICLLAGSRCIHVYCREKSHRSHFNYSSEPSMISDSGKKDQTVLIGGKNYSYSGSTLTPISNNSNAQNNFQSIPLSLNGALPQTPGAGYMAHQQQQSYQNFPSRQNPTDTLSILNSHGQPQMAHNIMAAIWAANQSQSNSSGSGPYSPNTMTGHEYDIPRSFDPNSLTLQKESSMGNRIT